MKKQKFKIKKVNKKGDISLWMLAIGVTIFAASLLIYMNKMENSLGNIGESTIKIMNTFEMSERTFFYMDASTEIAAKTATKELIDNSGYLETKFKGQIENPKCGRLAYPIIDSNKNLDDCFPNYEDALKIKFTRTENTLLSKYDPFQIEPAKFTAEIKQNTNEEMTIKVESLSNMNLPIYSFIESYYNSADKTKTTKKNINTVETTEDGYFTAKKYSALTSFQRVEPPSKIVIHDTGTNSLDETYEELYTGNKNYHYIIEKNGNIISITPEDRYTLSSGCTKTSEQSTCLIENTDKESISIALVNLIPSKIHTQKQIESLKNLTAGIVFRNPSIDLKSENIILNNEIDTSRIDPAPDLKNSKDKIIKAAIDINAGRYVAPTTSPIGTQEGQPEGTTNSLTESHTTGVVTGLATGIPSDIDLSKCFPNIRTTVYYTPFFEDIKIWSSTQSCTNSYDCCKSAKSSFYNDVRCQGSGVYNGKVYRYDTIDPRGAQYSPTLEGFKNGVTSSGTDPTPGRTVAAKCDSRFKKGTKLYIYWGEGMAGNGYYSVEDTGSALACNHIDIYAGPGKANLDAFAKRVKDTGTVCVLDKDFKMPDPDFSGIEDGSGIEFVDVITGEYNANYVHDVQIYNLTKLFENTKSFLSSAVQACKDLPSDKKIDCLNGQMSAAKTNPGLNVESCDKVAYKGISVVSDLPIASNPGTRIDFNKKILGKISEDPKITADKGNAVYLLGAQNTQTATSTSTPPLTSTQAQTQTLTTDWNNVRILAIGDSMTGAGNPAYPDKLKSILLSKGISASVDKRYYESCPTTKIKTCFEGSEIEYCKKSCRNGSTANFQKVDLNNYDVIIIWASINNIDNPEEVKNDLKDMYAYAKAQGKTVIALTVAPRMGYDSNVQKVNNEFILNKPANVDYVVDVYSDLIDSNTKTLKSEYFASETDRVHQNGVANTIIAQKIYDEVFSNTSVTTTNTQVNTEINQWDALIPFMSGNIESASIKVKDSTGDVSIDLRGSALEWVNYSNTKSELYISNSLLKKEDSVLVNIKYDAITKTYYVDDLSQIIPSPQDIEHQEFLNIVKQLGECATMEEVCVCSIDATRVLKNIKIENEIITNVNSGESLPVEFKVSQTLIVDMSISQRFSTTNIQSSDMLYWIGNKESNQPVCIPKKTYKYVCSSLVGDVDLGTIGFALKI